MKSPKFFALITVLFLPFLKTDCYSQIARRQDGSFPVKYVSRLDYEINSEFNNKGASGSVKYRLNQDNNVQAITFYDKRNLENINRIVFTVLENGYKAVANGVDLGLTWSKGRITSINNVRGGLHKSHFEKYTFRYNQDGTLQTINTYNSNKIQTIYQCVYDEGNLVELKNTYVFNDSFRAPTYTFTYYDKERGKGGFTYFNPVLGYSIPNEFDKFILFSVPEFWLGYETEDLLKTITVTDNYGSMTYNLTYEHDIEGYITDMKIEHRGIESTFHFEYETWN